MISLRPYMIRAIYEWAVDNDKTPMLAVRDEELGVEADAVKQQEAFVLYNIAPQAVRDLVIGEEGVRFHARFSGIPKFVAFDLKQVISVFCKESQTGVSFLSSEGEAEGMQTLPEGMMVVMEPSAGKELEPEKVVPDTGTSAPKPSSARSHLRVVRPEEE